MVSEYKIVETDDGFVLVCDGIEIYWNKNLDSLMAYWSDYEANNSAGVCKIVRKVDITNDMGADVNS